MTRRWVGFFADDRLLKVRLAGGPPQIVCDAPIESAGGTWDADFRTDARVGPDARRLGRRPP